MCCCRSSGISSWTILGAHTVVTVVVSRLYDYQRKRKAVPVWRRTPELLIDYPLFPKRTFQCWLAQYIGSIQKSRELFCHWKRRFARPSISVHSSAVLAIPATLWNSNSVNDKTNTPSDQKILSRVSPYTSYESRGRRTDSHTVQM